MAGPNRGETAEILSQVGRLLGDAQHQITLTIQQMEERLEHLRHMRTTFQHQQNIIAPPAIHEGSSGTSVTSQPPPLNETFSVCGSGARPPPNSTVSAPAFPHLDSSQGFSISSGSQMHAPYEPQSPFPRPIASSSVNAAVSEFPPTGALTRDLIPRPPPLSPCSPVGPPQSRTVQTQSRTQTQASGASSPGNFTATGTSCSAPPPPPIPPSPDIPPIQSDYQIVRCPECRARVGVYFEIYHLDQQ